MYGVVLLAAMTAGESAPEFHKGYPRHYGACFGACYGAGYEGWGGCAGGWGQPYSGYCGFGPHHGGGIPPQPAWPGYACFGGCGGYMSPAFGHAMPQLDTQTAGAVTAPAYRNNAGRAMEEKKGGKVGGEKKGKEEKTPKIDEDMEGREEQSGNTRAHLIITLPEGARLFVDDRPIAAAPAKKEFRTPQLERGEKYYYDLRAEVVRDGKKVTRTRRVVLEAGNVIRADFSSLGAQRGVASVEK